MAGANYMGGKRNAIKARTKDVTSRLQKGHFGKQRLNLILGHGVVRNGTQPLEPKPKAAAIDLAHARRNYPMRELPTGTYIPRPTTPKDLESHGSVLFAQSTIVRSKPSKLLTALEKFEPISFLSKKNRLLKFTDFAGLISQPKGTAFVADKTNLIPLSDGKRKVDASNVLPRQIKKRRRLSPLPVRDDSSSTAFPPSPSPAFPARLSAPCSDTSSIYSFQVSAGYSEMSADYHVSVAGHRDLKCDAYKDSFYSSLEVGWLEDDPLICQGERSSEDRSGITGGFDGQENTWETSDILKASAHPPSGPVSVELIEMSNEWRTMADDLQIGNFQRQQRTTCFQGNTQALGRLGVDFYVFPLLKPRALDPIDGSVRKNSTTDRAMATYPSDTPLFPLTHSRTILPITPKRRQGGTARAFVTEEEERKGSHMESIVPSPELTEPTLPVDTSLPFMELLEYDTQSESQQSHIYTSRASQLLTDDVPGSAGISAHTPSISATIDTLDCKLPFPSGPGESSYNIPTSLDHRDGTDGFSIAQSYPILSWDSLRENYMAKHDPTTELVDPVGATNVDIAVKPCTDLKRLHQSNVMATDPERDAGSVLKNVKTNIGDVVSIDLNICRGVSMAFAHAVHPKNGITASGHNVHPAVFQDYTRPEETSRGWKTTHADCGQGDGAGSKGLIEGPLLFALDNKEVEDEE